MTQQEVERAVMHAIRQIQTESGRECPRITNRTIPIGDLPGFDSLNALEATILIIDGLSVHIPDDTNVFVSEAGDSPLSISEVGRRVRNIAVGEESATHDR